MDTYLYPFFVTQKKTKITIVFPDFPDIQATAERLDVVYAAAIEALSKHLYTLWMANEVLPTPSEWESLVVPSGSRPFLASIAQQVVLDTYGSKPVKKMVSIPSWMNVQAEHAGLSLSKVLQQALKERLSK
ncbi:type II toxin-antitoxin system HicB family antitoxin [Listeria newyorkensis]|uniref:type II toxin-antitoxin system HicB family antitoxin n=1 Tax=Listeria newyorkensis TaxID=1497681 RepID=UPI00051D4F19|nr:type II toxin-antitoxin system HicB family antitoxin [Listeria newyorkensis]KGL43606.1 hypothetical protein EP58_07660 [Listeria newyorkensis]SQC56819.1 Uncharacterised protein [Listeria newyorkensis]